MIRKPPPGSMQDSRAVETVREMAQTTERLGKSGVRLGRKTGAFASAGCLGWLAFGASIAVLSTLASHADQIFSVRGLFATVIMLAIPGTLIALTIWQVKRANSI